ncbi:unnamed protein product [Effrenium voratum]|uniref:Uncharacterized protein n=1 Tax=Effrenium voratum TaxID=2562239 RepID=A0AA36NJX7_9DINO|nr:unnamed protein product [Effrenium voratum]CAJ1410182.1 unnamed protein product [Effrenium voratum]CAJ1452951.1 unnamed protein product [Effrenium voratum]
MHAESEDEYVPSVLRRPKVANHTLHETFTADTRDHEDHTFCGVMFDVQCKGPEEGGVPVECLVITCLAVRGDLGPLTVWTTPDSYRKKEHEAHEWDCIYEAEHPPSNENYQALELRSEIRLQPGESCGLYVHSKLPGDDALVYDNQRSHVSHEDDVFKVLPGQAHLSNRPFGRHGMWGFPWRDRREFVGRISYGVNYRLWNPVLDVHLRFPRSFRQAVWTILLCARKPESPLYWLHDEVLFYILNMCKYDWFSESRTRGRGSQFKLRAPALRGQAKGYQGGPAVQQVNLSLDVESTESESSHSGPTSNTSSW